VVGLAHSVPGSHWELLWVALHLVADGQLIGLTCLRASSVCVVLCLHSGTVQQIEVEMLK
jgi:hypothetical protein